MADANAPSSIDDIQVPTDAELASEHAQEQADQETKETKKPAKAADEDQGDQVDETEEQSDEEEAADEADDQADEELDSDSEESDEETDDEKARNREGYFQRTRSQIRGRVTAKLDSLARPQTTEALIEQGVDPALAEVEVLRQEMQRKDAITYVTDLNAELNIDAQNVVRDFPVFDEKSPEYDKEFADEVEARYAKAAKLKMDPSGEFVVNSEESLYDFYAWAAKLRGSSIRKGAAKGQKSAERMLAAAEAPSSSAPPVSDEEKDPFLRGLMGKGNHN